jgi:uncharacterized membrane protein YkvA (DUF1232 family)
LIPDFIPVLGYLDDLIILPLLIYSAIKIIPKNILEECKQEAKEAAIERKWYYAIPIITVWIIIAIIIVKSIVIGE